MSITALMEDRITENGHIINLFTRTAPNTWVFTNYIQNYGPGTDGGLSISAGAVEPTQDEKIGAIAELEFDPTNPDPAQNESLYFYGQGFPTRDKIQILGILGSDSLWDDLAGNVSFGAWRYNNTYWVLVPDTTDPTICVRKSVDEGTTWTKVDAGNQPDFFQVPGPLFRYDDVTHKIYLWRPDDPIDDTSFVLQAFNLVTELWETPFGALTLDSSENDTNSSNGIIRFPNGDFGVFYYRDNGGSTLYYRLYASGAWGSEIVVAVGTRDTNKTGLTVIIDPSKELIHVFYPDTTAGVSTLGFNYRTVTHSGTVSDVIFNFPPRHTNGLGFGIINDGNIFIPYFDTTGNSSGGQSSVFVAPLATGQFVEELIPVQPGQEATDPYLGFNLFLPSPLPPPPARRTPPGIAYNPSPLLVPPIIRNIYADCLAWDYTLLRNIDRTMICKKRPDCTNVLEPEWVEAPVGAIQFNKSKPIPLPAPASGDVVVASTRVPFGYDGILTGHFHLFTQLFDEGAGDILWRIRVNGRYLRDMGQMLFSMGDIQHLSPCPGGLWLLSGNLVEYVVSAPNTGGSLPVPGQGQVIAGLSGWFFPRM